MRRFAVWILSGVAFGAIGYGIAALAFVLMSAAIGGWASAVVQEAFSWTGVLAHQQPLTAWPCVFILPAAGMTGALGASLLTPWLRRARVVLPILWLTPHIIIMQVNLAAMSRFERHCADGVWPMVLPVSSMKAVILCLLTSLPGMVMAAWLGTLLRPGVQSGGGTDAHDCARKAE